MAKGAKTVETLGISPIAPNLLIDWERRMIYEAVLRGDPDEVRAAVENHILRTKNNLIIYLELLNSENLK